MPRLQIIIRSLLQVHAAEGPVVTPMVDETPTGGGFLRTALPDRRSS
jgi:hypothetical protein